MWLKELHSGVHKRPRVQHLVCFSGSCYCWFWTDSVLLTLCDLLSHDLGMNFHISLFLRRAKWLVYSLMLNLKSSFRVPLFCWVLGVLSLLLCPMKAFDFALSWVWESFVLPTNSYQIHFYLVGLHGISNQLFLLPGACTCMPWIWSETGSEVYFGQLCKVL